VIAGQKRRHGHIGNLFGGSNGILRCTTIKFEHNITNLYPDEPHLKRMTHNDENRLAERPRKRGKTPQPGRRRRPLARMT
jgi:hypothetical protein